MLTVRVGCDIHFECESSATAILLVNPRRDSTVAYCTRISILAVPPGPNCSPMPRATPLIERFWGQA